MPTGGIRLQLCSVGALKIYFAGPLFTPYERSFIDECAAALRADGFEVFVPHEHELATGVDVTAAWIFAKDRPGIERADAMLAILDGPSVDDGTACEIGMFHALMQSDPSKKGIVGLLTDIRGMRGESTGVNLFVQGAIEDVGRIVASIEEARDVLPDRVPPDIQRADRASRPLVRRQCDLHRRDWQRAGQGARSTSTAGCATSGRASSSSSKGLKAALWGLQSGPFRSPTPMGARAPTFTSRRGGAFREAFAADVDLRRPR